MTIERDSGHTIEGQITIAEPDRIDPSLEEAGRVAQAVSGQLGRVISDLNVESLDLARFRTALQSFYANFDKPVPETIEMRTDYIAENFEALVNYLLNGEPSVILPEFMVPLNLSEEELFSAFRRVLEGKQDYLSYTDRINHDSSPEDIAARKLVDRVVALLEEADARRLQIYTYVNERVITTFLRMEDFGNVEKPRSFFEANNFSRFDDLKLADLQRTIASRDYSKEAFRNILFLRAFNILEYYEQTGELPATDLECDDALLAVIRREEYLYRDALPTLESVRGQLRDNQFLRYVDQTSKLLGSNLESARSILAHVLPVNVASFAQNVDIAYRFQKLNSSILDRLERTLLLSVDERNSSIVPDTVSRFKRSFLISERKLALISRCAVDIRQYYEQEGNLPDVLLDNLDENELNEILLFLESPDSVFGRSIISLAQQEVNNLSFELRNHDSFAYAYRSVDKVESPPVPAPEISMEDLNALRSKYGAKLRVGRRAAVEVYNNLKASTSSLHEEGDFKTLSEVIIVMKDLRKRFGFDSDEEFRARWKSQILSD